MADKEKVLEIEVTDYDRIELLRNGIEEYRYRMNPEAGEETEQDPQKTLKVEVTDFDEIVLLRGSVEEYRYTTHPKVGEKGMVRNPSFPDDGIKRLSMNFYYLEDAGFIDWWED